MGNGEYYILTKCNQCGNEEEEHYIMKNDIKYSKWRHIFMPEVVTQVCVCCTTNEVGDSGIMCESCWKWITEHMTMNDVVVVIAGIAGREPDNELAVKIRNYIVADNYTFGKATLK